EVKSELNQEAGQLKSFCSLGTELSQSKALSDTQSLLDHDLLNDWESQRSRIQELNKTGVPQINGSAGPSSLNGIHTCKAYWLSIRLLSDLTELQVTISDVNARYDALGSELKERLSRQQASLELRQKARQSIEVLRSWLSDREQSLKQGQTTSPSKPEVVRAQTQQNKTLVFPFLSFRFCSQSWLSTLESLCCGSLTHDGPSLTSLHSLLKASSLKPVTLLRTPKIWRRSGLNWAPFPSKLSSSIASLSERLDAQASLSAQPEALKRRLQETGEIRSELERRRTELVEAERLCGELSAIVAEPYLKEELSKRLENINGPLRSLEERAGSF
ncbi:hypothetical protein XENOCAPTIV_026473, partial [Xenoophorus captivus]